MPENGSESLPFEAPEQENIRVREENALLQRLLAVHCIPIPQLAKRIDLYRETSRRRHRRTRTNVPKKGSRCFEACFAGEKMSTDGDGRPMMAGTDSRPGDRKKVDQKTRKFLPLTDSVIENHPLLPQSLQTRLSIEQWREAGKR
jgi:hypothetical protein